MIENRTTNPETDDNDWSRYTKEDRLRLLVTKDFDFFKNYLPQLSEPGKLMGYEHEIKFAEIYKKGLEIAREKSHNADAVDRLHGESKYFGTEYFQQLISTERQVTKEQKSEIIKKATAIFHRRNILFHETLITRIPLIGKLGLMSRNLTDKITKRKFDGYTRQGSGWGIPFEGSDYIDVHDPTMRQAVEAESSAGKYKIIKELQKQVDGTSPIDYSIDEGFDSSGFGDPARRGKAVFAIKPRGLKNQWLRTLDYHGNAHAYIKGRIKHKELLGIVVGPFSLEEFERLIQYAGGSTKRFTKDELLEIMGEVTMLPIYDPKGNLVWPGNIEASKLVT